MRKSLIILITNLLLANICLAEEERFFGVNYNFLTHHFSSVGSDKFDNKVSNDGKTIKNPLIGLEFSKNYKKSSDKWVLFGGEDSIGSPMFGVYKGYGFQKISNKGFHGNFLLGMYFFDQRQWDKRYADSDIRTPSLITGYLGIENVNIIIGIELNYHIPLGKKSFIKINNIITPLVTNHGVGIVFEF